jgi:hypothetical protein
VNPRAGLYNAEKREKISCLVGNRNLDVQTNPIPGFHVVEKYVY